MLSIVILGAFLFVTYWALKGARSGIQKGVALLPAPLFIVSALVVPRLLPDLAGMIGVLVAQSMCVVAALMIGSHWRTLAMRAALEE